ncbi:Na/Pi cotransporter family protein [Moellerella wisconsensis]|uniref:Sodium-dependent phosphate transporter n=3 Tax=Moellerella wisconsensis TaxID=158849 RepID=A0A0N1KHV2_9GAMM|nr:Na/Pi cotransporter family protein [Moellerella wisconsensis]KLN97802.1 membrane protein [Moellerella wisconsensis]KPD03418.1 sodium-dependent phosphate transporter [Moellerella wisconsensis ATCC 35017]UNH23780.1 Na/Pi cotransporter family protein [Moellerella wisconsensis]UNH26868.1 Na/Pi cotransporter family protein [Moellerella wisconsensis]UNH30352.1 Na/Pi cotransporter family protein [Moellerella wisconsensis]
MLILLHLLSSVALLVWGTHIVRTGIMRVFGADLRRILGKSINRKSNAFLAGVGVTALVQSSNATAMLVISFVSQGLISLAPAMVIMLGADVGTALMARVLTFDLSWLSPLLILAGVSTFLSHKKNRIGQMGRVGIGLGLILLALQLIVAAAEPITHAEAVRTIFTSLSGDVVLALLVGAIFAMISYSSLAAVLITATLSATGLVPLYISLCIVIGSNIGSGLLALMSSRGQNEIARQVVLGSLFFKLIGCLIILPWIKPLSMSVDQYGFNEAEVVIYFHVFYNLIRCLIMLPFVGPMARVCMVMIPTPPKTESEIGPRYLDKSALETPSLAIANAVRETLRMGDVVEQMLQRFIEVLNGNKDQRREINHLEEEVDMLHSSIKLYLAQLQQNELSEDDSRRWAEIIDTALNLQQSATIIHRMTSEMIKKSLDNRCSFSPNGFKELNTLMERLQHNLSLGMSVFVSGDLDNARRLRRAKHRFRLLNQRYAYSHVERLHEQNMQSLDTSNLHVSLLGDMKRLNSLFSAVAYHALEGIADQRAEQMNIDHEKK